MRILSQLMIFLVSVEHIYFFYLETFAWTSPSTRRKFATTAEFATASRALAANQGLYNSFLAAGLSWSLLHHEARFAWQLQAFFLTCVIAAALFGAFTVKRSILLIQGVPALLALILAFLTS